MGLFGNGPDFTGTVRSLLNIEVNTILADSMSAEPMPPLPHAVLDIADWYATYLCRLGAELDPYLGVDDEASLKAVELSWSFKKSFSSDRIRFQCLTFEALRCAAEAALGEKPVRDPPLTALERVMIYRIQKNCDAMKTLMRNLDASVNKLFLGRSRDKIKDVKFKRGDYTIEPDDIVTLQRIWDLGTQVIVAQTVVFLNGNVTTRIQKGLDDEKVGTLAALHRGSVDVSISCWHYLLQAIREIAGTALSTLIKAK